MGEFVKGRFQSHTHVWSTPRTFFDALDREFAFDLDVAALPENAKCARYFTPDDDGLKQDWSGATCWMNPPYGNEMRQWVKKALDHHLGGGVIVCLLPIRSNTNWWHDLVIPYAEIRFLRGRLRFNNVTHGLPAPLAVTVYSGKRLLPRQAVRSITTDGVTTF